MRAIFSICLVLALVLSCGGKKREPGAAEGAAAALTGEPAPAGGSAAGASDEPAADTKSAKAEADKGENEAAQQADKIVGYVREPMTAVDVEETVRFAKAWRSNAAFQRARDAWQEMNKVTDKKDESIAGEMRKTRTITKVVGAVDDIEDAFYALIKASGGPERHYARSVRVGAVVAAAEQIAKTAKARDPQSDRVADLMLEQRGDIVKEFRLSIEELREAKKRGGDPPIVTAFIEGPGAVALAMMPEPSFQVWRKLSEAQRQELRDLLKDTTTPASWVMEMPAGALLFAAAIEIAEKTPEAVLPK